MIKCDELGLLSIKQAVRLLLSGVSPISISNSSSDSEKVTKIVVSEHGAGTEFRYKDKIVATNIPALNVFEWNSGNIFYLESWLGNTLNDEIVIDSYRITISASLPLWNKK